MPIETTFESRGVVRKLSGFVTADEFIASAHRIECHPEFDRFRYLIDDFTASHGNSIDADTLEELAVICFGAKATNSGLQVVIVMTDQGMRASVESRQQRPEDAAFKTTVVPTMAAARAFLGLKPD